MLAGPPGAVPSASLCLVSQSDWLEGMKKAPELTAQEPRKQFEIASADSAPRLNAEGTAAAAGALHIGIVKLESRTLDALDVIDLNPLEIHRTHLVDGNL